jgi:HlyD family secretion protein
MEDYKMRCIGLNYSSLLSIILLFSCSGDDSTPGGSGLIEATEVVLSAKTGGQLVKLNVDEGSEVFSGDTIGIIDTITTKLRLEQSYAYQTAVAAGLKSAEIYVEQADLNSSLTQKEYDRAIDLIKSGSVNQQQYDKAETARNQAILAKKQSQAAVSTAEADLQKIQAEIALLLQQLNDCFPSAPSGGVISEKYIEVGELVNVGAPIVKIARLDTVTVKVYLPASDLTRIKLGGVAQIDAEDNSGRLLSGTITWISPKAEFTPKNVQTKEARANLVYAVKITIPNPEQILKIGMPVAIKII